MKFKLKRIDWYIIKQFLGTYIFAIALIIAISVVFDINEKIDKFLSPDVPLKAIVFDYYMNFIPYFANLFSPLFTFIAVIFFTSKLADNSEVIAMLASGMSFRRLMLPYAISAGIIALSTFVLNAYIIPPANATRIDFQNKYIKNNVLEVLANGSLNYTVKGIHIGMKVIWNYTPPSDGGDTFTSLKKGSKATLKTIQDKESGFVKQLYIQRAAGSDHSEIESQLQKAIKQLQATYPFLSVKKMNEGLYLIDIPQADRLGHEAHFSKVAEAFLGYLHDKNMPEWENENTISKYYITTTAVELAKKEK